MRSRSSVESGRSPRSPSLSRPRVLAALALALGAVPFVLAVGCEATVTVVDTTGCAPGEIACGASGCIDPYTDAVHCGECDNTCLPTEFCDAGLCVDDLCPPGLAKCKGVCVDVLSDADHCGACGVSCGGPCESGKCASECEDGLSSCDGACVDTSSDPEHCGSCNVACSAFGTCVGGICNDCDGPCGLCKPVEALVGPLPITTVGSTAGETNQIPTSCGEGSPAPEAVYAFVAPASGAYSFSVASGDPGRVVLLGGCAELACSNNGSVDGVNLQVGQEVLVIVEGTASELASFTLTVTSDGPSVCPEGDLGVGAPAAVVDDASLGTDHYTPPCDGTPSPDRSYAFTPTSDGLYRIELFSSGGPLTLSAHTGDCTGGVLGCATSANPSILAPLQGGQPISVVVGFTNAASDGGFELFITEEVDPIACEPTPLTLFPGQAMGSTSGADDDLGGSCGGDGSPDVAFQFTAPSSGTFVFETTNTPFDSVLHAHQASCGGPELACDDDGGAGLNSQIALTMFAGQTVIVYVDGFDGSSGPFTLLVSGP